MIKYEITKRETCPVCNGAKKVEAYEWRDYNFAERVFKVEHGRNMNEAEFDAYWKGLGYEDIPAEESWCGTCEGTGIIETKMELVDALNELGVLK